jgi:hypothetical protein
VADKQNKIFNGPASLLQAFLFLKIADAKNYGMSIFASN